jgi:hypothetical protein
MNVLSYGSNYYKLKTDLVAPLFTSPSSLTNTYSLISVTGTKNTDTPITENLTLGSAGAWYIDLSTPVGLGSSLRELWVQSADSLVKSNVLTTAIDLSYVNTNCTNPVNRCTLSDFSSHFAPLFKSAIDSWFTARGISSGVVIAFSGNTVIISTFVSSYFVYSATYGVSTPYTEILAGYGNTTGNLILSSEEIIVKSSFFGKTAIEDGIYKFAVKYTKVNNAGFITETNCTFIDVTIKCKVASLLNKLKEEADSKEEDSSTLAHVLHYALTNGSNCNCNCDELVTIYTELNKLLINTTVEDCSGC